MSSSISILLNDGTQVVVNVNSLSSYTLHVEGDARRTEIEEQESIGERRMKLLQKYVYKGRKHASGSSTKEETVADVKDVVCTICLEKVKVGEAGASTPCMQEFHTSCIQRWFQKASTCPFCCSNIDI
ncbi:hypothetical protein HPP92_022066 [Vanilla planifolia]|uniref:RING-type E3 ubiquitin transferase n=1 Tax=Vanilla planifolia TaxID=51239 RepID=A0A835PU23_VANPL|nr:hypothetical protein HPP92_022066 [Vanilla planifolia]